MPLSRQEIKENALKFAKEWEEALYEKGESQTFWNEFFAVFGIQRKQIAVFEERVKNIRGHNDFIDLFWPGKMLAEHKSRGADLGKATSQAYQYVCNLINQGRSKELPRYIIVSDFARIVLHDLTPDEGGESILEFPLSDLHQHIGTFGFISGYETYIPKLEDPANLIASELMGDVHDALLESGYSGHNLERFLVRILFCLFAEDTGIFSPDTFTLYIKNFSSEDGSDLGSRIGTFFDNLDTPQEKRQKNLDDLLASLRYVDGGLFRETLRPPTCNRKIRDTLLKATQFDWSKISPAVFGSLFQCVMDKDARRNFGAHYTTEENILKLIRPLFLDGLRAEFSKIKMLEKGKLQALQAFHEKLGSLTFFDPSCGCGNFLVLAYRELRKLDLDVFDALHRTDQRYFDATFFSQIDVDQFYGIEIVEFPVRIAETALWLMDHQMNLEVSKRYGRLYDRLPLKKSATIVHNNALRIDWNDVLPKEKCSYVLGNPPFVGGKYQNAQQREDLQLTFGSIRNIGLLDYVACWYYKAAEYIQGTTASVGFVSTNSITQGEQVGVLWSELFAKRIHIRFAYRTFVWSSEARGKAHVHCVIIGFGLDADAPKTIYEQVGTNLVAHKASQINRYLIDAPDVAIVNRSKPLCNVPEMTIGNKPIDDGNYLFTEEEQKEFLKCEPGAAPYFRKWLGADEFLNGPPRWCLWLGDCPPERLRQLKECLKRVDAVQRFRQSSKSLPTQAIADKPTRFHVENIPTKRYLLIPRVSSERRRYIPVGFVSPEMMASDATLIIPDATPFHFGVLTSMMHNVWMRQVCGRLKSDYRYSAKIVYNNFPWPENINAVKIERIEEKAQRILEVRKEYPNSTLADLYDPLTMPNDLRKSHRELDQAVDRAYRSQPFTNDTNRLSFLFELYEKLAIPPVPLLPEEKKPKRRKKTECQ